MVNRLLERDPPATILQTATNPFSDLYAPHWAYLQILEAAVVHEHELTPEQQEELTEQPAQSGEQQAVQ